MTKIIAVLGISLCASLYGLYWQVQQSGKLKSEISQYEQLVKAKDALLAKERQNAAEVALRAQEFYEQEARDNEELEKLRACHADKSCWPRVRIKTSCPSVSGTAASTGTSEEITAELGEDAGRTALRLRAEIKETKRLIEGLQQELIARSHPDYCKAK